MRCELRLVAAGTTAGLGLALCIATAGWAAGPRELVPYNTWTKRNPDAGGVVSVKNDWRRIFSFE